MTSPGECAGGMPNVCGVPRIRQDRPILQLDNEAFRIAALQTETAVCVVIVDDDFTAEHERRQAERDGQDQDPFHGIDRRPGDRKATL